MQLPCARVVLFLIAILGGLATSARATDYYVAPSGGSDAVGQGLTYETPLATFSRAITLSAAGDTIFALGGTYNLSAQVSINKSGTAANPIKLFAFPGETPILNFASMADTDSNRGVSLTNNANWWHVKGLTIQNAGDNGLYTEGDDGVFEQLVLRNNRDSGLQLHGSATRNLVLNCDSYENFDPPEAGEDADGFAAKFAGLGAGNIFRGNRAWGNSDDGWDTWNSANGVLIQNSWSFDNGINIWGVDGFAGDGTGYKLGKPGGQHVLTNLLAIDNRNGIDINENGSFVQVYNSTSFSNNRNWQFDYDGGALHLLKNNVSLDGSQSDNFDSAVTSFNTWNGIPVDSNDFLSTDRFDDTTDLLKLPRQGDGSLPDIGGFLKLASGSNLINAGTPISFVFNGVTYNLPFDGSAPDLGAFEFVPPPPTVLRGDFNDDDLVNAADYTVWRNHFGEPDETNINGSGDGGDVGAGDYDVWRAHFGDTPETGGGGLGGGPVPEPASWLLALMATMLLGTRRR